jgi:ATP-dependent DNA helicase RecQ
MTALEVLKKYWGYDAFRPLQSEIIESALSGRDTLALLPTGGGKSVCFQIPAIVKGGICLVISPLIALMKDQVEQLNKRGIKAAAVYSGMSAKEIDFALDNCVYDPEMRFLYLSPERLKTELFKIPVKKMPVRLLAVDEAHCISQWGYDFRPPYMQIAEIREILPSDVPCMALTASATEKVCKDIVRSLHFKQEYAFFKKSFARENLWYSCFEEENKLDKMLKILEKVPGTSVIYVRNRAKTQQTAEILKKRGISADFYHAGLAAAERAKKQENWINNQTRVIVATNAFGMGIDKADVRTVIHLDLPDSMEAYYQEAGRAGRDGQKAFPVLLFDNKDLDNLRENIENSHPSIEKIRNTYAALCNYFQLAVGGGEMMSFPFDFQDFCQKFNLPPGDTFHCLKKAEEQGILLMSEALHTPSALRFVISGEDLYRFQVSNPSADFFVKNLVRMYGGDSFSQYVRINETQIAKILTISVEKVVLSLQNLDKSGVLSYLPASDKPKISFLIPRAEQKNLPLNTQYMSARKENALEKAENMIHYARNTTKCRALFIMNCFDEKNDVPCGVCDICLKNKKIPFISDADLEKAILQAFSEGKMSKEALIKRVNSAYEVRIIEILRKLYEKKVIQTDEDKKIFLR